ncbi:RDD family protein [Streptomyces sp. NPDC057136]|uniref:RDD family protein n=1 Tax=Streptomyces sp. NPDC057136 TaxID=3346029 RepID=UPI003627AA5B
MRRYLAVAVDCYLCLLAAGLLTRPHVGMSDAGRALPLLLAFALVLSFANQVLLTVAVRASAGKLVMGVRVVAMPGVGRPGLGRLVRRWVHGLRWVPLQPWHWLRSLSGPARGSGDCPLLGSEDGDPYEDVAGLRQVRHVDLLAYRAAVAGRAA